LHDRHRNDLPPKLPECVANIRAFLVNALEYGVALKVSLARAVRKLADIRRRLLAI
jgi:hypothetical protein